MSSTSITLKPQNGYAILIMGALFFILGFVTWINGTLIPFLKIICELETDTQAFFVVTASYMAYFFMALPSAGILKYTGYKKGMAMGLLIMMLGTLVFLPAAYQRSFNLFLAGLFIQGAGMALLQTAVNPYISIIGPIESAASRISIMGICNKVAGAISPLALGTLLLSKINAVQHQLDVEGSHQEQILATLAQRIVLPYAIMAGVLAILAVLILRSALPEIEEEKEVARHSQTRSIFSFPHLWFGVLCIFLYVGVEVLAGDAIGTYGNSIGIPLEESRFFTSMTLSAMLLGYIVGVFAIPRFLQQQTALKLSAILGALLSLGVYVAGSTYTAIYLIALLGFANALMWPAIFPLAVSGLGAVTKIGAALLIMGIAGGAIMPLIFGALKQMQNVGTELGFLICLLPAYLYILFYAIIGWKLGKPASVNS